MSVGIRAPVTRSRRRTFLTTRSAGLVPRPWVMRAASVRLSIFIGQPHVLGLHGELETTSGMSLRRDHNGTRLHVVGHKPDPLPCLGSALRCAASVSRHLVSETGGIRDNAQVHARRIEAAVSATSRTCKS